MMYDMIHKNKNSTTIVVRVRVLPRLCGFCPGFWLATEEKARINLSEGSRRVPAGTMKVHKHTIRIHGHKNKNKLQ